MLQFQTQSSPYITIGINTGHDGGCCIIAENKCVAISEERLNRVKHSSQYLYSLQYCLETLGLKLADVRFAFFSSYHEPLPTGYSGILAQMADAHIQCKNVDHHLSHAYNTYYFSGYDEALIIIIDGLGNNLDTESYYIGRGTTIKKIGGNDYGTNGMGIGRAYESFTNYIGRDSRDAGKTMGLSAYGAFTGKPGELFYLNDKLSIVSNLRKKYESGIEEFLKPLGYTQLIAEKGLLDGAINIASYVQYQCEDIILELVRKLIARTGIRKLCLGGGVALNGLINNNLLSEGVVDEIYIPTTACDTGQCIGNALAGLAQEGIYIQEHIDYPSYGRIYSQSDILDVLEKKQQRFILPSITKRTSIKYEQIADKATLLSKVARYIHTGKIVGWFQEGSECGARALGYRSILANPTLKHMRDYINQKVKHREAFRPFGCSVLESDISQYFHYHASTSPFMMFICEVKEAFRDILSPVTHIDNTCRIQTVNEHHGLYYELLQILKHEYGLPGVLNTSFNDNNEPIVETPAEALKHLCLGHVDVLILHNYIVINE